MHFSLCENMCIYIFREVAARYSHEYVCLCVCVCVCVCVYIARFILFVFLSLSLFLNTRPRHSLAYSPLTLVPSLAHHSHYANPRYVYMCIMIGIICVFFSSH